MKDQPIRVLFVCLGNICRSPLAEGVFRHLAASNGHQARFDVDSAGTGAWHVGERADPRMRETAERHGVTLTSRARQFTAADFHLFDHILAMDRSNLDDILALDRTDQFSGKVHLFRDWDPDPEDGQVPDPYYGDGDGFERVYAIVDRTARHLLEDLASS